MKMILATLLFSVSALATAHNCPNEMKAIDAKLSSTKGISAENLTMIKALRAEGDQFHKEGKHDASMKSLLRAKKLLGM